MSFLSNIFSRSQASGSVPVDGPEPWEAFEAEHGRECYQIESKIRNVKTDGLDPEKNLAGFDRQVALAHELEDFCRSHGPGGSEFFQINFSSIYADIQMYRDQYLAEDYEADKIAFAEMKAEKAAVQKVSKLTLGALRSSGGSMLQKELKKEIPEDLVRYFDRSVRGLLEKGKIEKSKDRSFVRYSLK